MPWQQAIKPHCRLLVFAHRAEAQSFLREGNWSPVTNPFDGLLFNEELAALCLITGEGRQNATMKTAAVLGPYAERISKVINFGVAGNLRTLKTDEIYPVRTVYASEGDTMVVKSFTTSMGENHPKESVDCISSDQRVLDAGLATKLSYFADLVDRELWSIASTCQLFSLPFDAYKIVSDSPTENSTVCELVKQKAGHYSDRLFQFFQNLEIPKETRSDSSKPWPLTDDRLHFTVAMERQLERLWKSLLLKGIEPVSAEEMEDVLNHDGFAPKQRAGRLINLLNEQLDPLGASVLQNIHALTEPYRKEGIFVRFPHIIEDERFSLSANIKDRTHLTRVIGLLEKFPYAKLNSILNGELDV